MPRSRTSFIWDYFTKDENGEARCDTCMKTIAVNGGSTSNLIKHLKCKHKEVLDQSETATAKDEYILLQGENYETSYIQAENEKIEVEHPTHYEIIPAPKPKKPKLSHVETDMRVVKQWTETARSAPNRVAVPEDNSLEIFARYMISLMKDIPKKKCEDVQLKIVSLILAAKREDEQGTEDQSRSMENGHN